MNKIIKSFYDLFDKNNRVIQLIQETKFSGEVLYYSKVDGMYVPNSQNTDSILAKEIYDELVKNNGEFRKIIILNETNLK